MFSYASFYLSAKEKPHVVYGILSHVVYSGFLILLNTQSASDYKPHLTTQSNSVLFYTLQTWRSFNCQRKLDYPKKTHALVVSAHIQIPEGKVQIRNVLAVKYQC